MNNTKLMFRSSPRHLLTPRISQHKSNISRLRPNRMPKRFNSSTSKMPKNTLPESAAPIQTQNEAPPPPPPNPYVLKPKYANFAKVQASRPPFDPDLPLTTTQPPSLNWKYGSSSPPPSLSPSPPNSNTSANPTSHPSSLEASTHLEIDPLLSSTQQNYRLLISAVPRPIALVSTLSSLSSSPTNPSSPQIRTTNLAPFSYFALIDHSPPTFILGFSTRSSRVKDTQRNLLATRECVINIVSEHMVQAMNGASIDVPYGVSEWGLSGFTPAQSTTVEAERVKEAVVSIEGRLVDMREWSHGGKGAEGKGKQGGAMAIIEGTRFWVRNDAVNESDGVVEVDFEKLRPVVQLGGMMYGRVRDVFELPRPGLEMELADEEKGLRRVLEADQKRGQEKEGEKEANGESKSADLCSVGNLTDITSSV